MQPDITRSERREGFLTIDDSPSNQTDEYLDWLKERDIQALFFCIGERLTENSEPMIRAVREGHILGNHSWSHPRSSQVGLTAMLDEIDRTEDALNDIYREAGVERDGLYFRFPHMDRGMGGYIVDFDAMSDDDARIVVPLFRDGINISLDKPSDEQRELCQGLQHGLKQRGFTAPPFAGVSFAWFTETEMGTAIDAMYTYSTSDWMLLPRHRGKWPWASVEELNARADTDVTLLNHQSRHIILAHDKDDFLLEETALLQHLLDTGMSFVSFK
jgi:peptidoglycan/xylan/chitin deacetylase (PgdA/CDA1 family)